MLFVHPEPASAVSTLLEQQGSASSCSQCTCTYASALHFAPTAVLPSCQAAQISDRQRHGRSSQALPHVFMDSQESNMRKRKASIVQQPIHQQAIKIQKVASLHGSLPMMPATCPA